MKLLLVIDHLGPAGAQRQLVTLGVSLKARGHVVEFFIYYPHINHFRKVLENAGIPVHAKAKRSAYDTGPPRRLRKIIRTGKHDVALSFLTTPNIYNVLTTLGTTTKAVVSERSTFPTEHV